MTRPVWLLAVGERSPQPEAPSTLEAERGQSGDPTPFLQSPLGDATAPTLPPPPPRPVSLLQPP